MLEAIIFPPIRILALPLAKRTSPPLISSALTAMKCILTNGMCSTLLSVIVYPSELLMVTEPIPSCATSDLSPRHTAPLIFVSRLRFRSCFGGQRLGRVGPPLGIVESIGGKARHTARRRGGE